MAGLSALSSWNSDGSGLSGLSYRLMINVKAPGAITGNCPVFADDLLPTAEIEVKDGDVICVFIGLCGPTGSSNARSDCAAKVPAGGFPY